MAIRKQSAYELSVVIPTRDRAGMVEKAVASVLDHADERVQVIVSDDGSRDDTLDRLRRFQDSRLTLVESASPGGANFARNQGAREALAPVVAFLDSDDVFLPGRSERLVEYYRGHPMIDCTLDGYVDHSRRRVEVHRLPQEPVDGKILRHMLIAHQLPLTNSTIAIRKQAFEAVGGFDEKLPRHQDRDLLLRVAVQHRVALGNAIDVHKFRAPASISHDFKGYVRGLDAFAARVPEAKLPNYEDLFRYLTVRGVFKAVLQGHPVIAWQEFRSAQASGHLPRGFLKSVVRYSAGHRFRKMSRSQQNRSLEKASASDSSRHD